MTAPLAVRIIKPLFRGIVKTAVGVALEMKKAGEEVQDIAAEVSADKATRSRMSR